VNVKYTKLFLVLVLGLAVSWHIYQLVLQKKDTAFNIQAVSAAPEGIYLRATLNAVAIKQNLCYVGLGGEIQLWDIADVRQPRKLKDLATGGIVMELGVQGELLFAACGCAGLYIFDISDPLNPYKLSVFTSQDWVSAFALHGKYLYVADGKAGCFVLDIVDPTHPKEISHLANSGRIQDIFIHNSYAYLACGEEGLRIIDIFDDKHPQEISHFKIDFTDTPDQKTQNIFLEHQYRSGRCIYTWKICISGLGRSRFIHCRYI